MEKSNKIVQIYGYLVCLVSIITLITSIPTLVVSIIDMSDPLHTGSSYNETKLTSFENYKMNLSNQVIQENDSHST